MQNPGQLYTALSTEWNNWVKSILLALPGVQCPLPTDTDLIKSLNKLCTKTITVPGAAIITPTVVDYQYTVKAKVKCSNGKSYTAKWDRLSTAILAPVPTPTPTPAIVGRRLK